MTRFAATFLLVFAACTSSSERVATTNEEPGPPVRYLALGDSYTIGESVDADQRWPSRLAREIEDNGYSIVDLQIVARTGWTTSDLAAAIDGAEPQGPFDLVTLQIGVNNQFRGLDIDQYRDEFSALLQRAIGLAGGEPSRVVVVSIPDWGMTPFGSTYDGPQIAREIDAFNVVARQATTAGARWVDITPISRGDDPALVAGDGLHPSGSQYAAWVQVILPPALAALG